MSEDETPIENRHLRPRWVTIAFVIGAVLAVAILLHAVLGGGGHGLGRHGG